jgi:hypothetical protein
MGLQRSVQTKRSVVSRLFLPCERANNPKAGLLDTEAWGSFPGRAWIHTGQYENAQAAAMLLHTSRAISESAGLFSAKFQ